MFGSPDELMFDLGKFPCFQVKRQSSFFSPQAVGEHHIAEAGRFLYGWADDGGANVL